MASSTPTSSPVRQEHNSHPYAIKTSHTGLLTRSNSSKAHGSWSRHHYTPVPPSPSAFVFDPPESSPSPTRRHTKQPSDAQSVHASPSNKPHKFDSPQRSERSESMSPSPSKFSKTWLGRNSEGEQVKLPRHPYLWTPAQLATYLSSELYGGDGESLDPSVVKSMVDFVEQQKIGGRAFLGLDQEDFQEMEGVDSVWGNALWDASCTLRQDAAPYRPSRISSAAYKRGRVRGIVNVFERSASESSDVGEDDAQATSPGKSAHARGLPTGKHRRQTLNQGQYASESEDDSANAGAGAGRTLHAPPRTNSGASGNSQLPLQNAPLASDVHNAVHNAERQVPPGAQADPGYHPHTSDVFGPVEGDLAAILPPRSGTPTDLVLGLDESQDRNTDLPEPGPHDDNTPNNTTREVEIMSVHQREESEPTMAELYEQTYGAPAPQPQEPLAPDDPSDEEAPPGETVKILPAAQSSPDHPPTALRPIARRKALTPPRSLRHLFVPSPVLESAGGSEPQPVYVLPASSAERDEAALRTLDALKARLEIVERRLEAMERKDAEAQRSHDIVVPKPRRLKANGNDYIPLSDPDVFGLEVHPAQCDEGLDGEALRTWQSAYILLAGATTGVSVVLIPMLLRHLWTR